MRQPIAVLSIGIGLGVGVGATLAGFAAHHELTNELHQALQLTPDRERGRALYDTCAACHQADGRGEAQGGIPTIAGQHYQVIVKELVDFRDAERLEQRMEVFTSQHHLAGPQDLADVAAFISSLPVRPTSDFGAGKALLAGEQTYARACRHCHGAAAEGDDQLRYPRLAGQHYRYLIKQIDAMIAGARFNVSWDHAKLLESLTDEEITGVADYLARLGTSSDLDDAAVIIAGDPSLQPRAPAQRPGGTPTP